jgi:general secretion pathway protein H
VSFRQRPVWKLYPPSRGFTLLEVLVVMLIMGIVISFAALSLKGNDNQLDEEARRLQALIALAGQEAVLQSRELALEFTPDGYDFIAYDGSQWQPLADDEVLRARTLPEDLALDYQAEGDKMTIGSKDDDTIPPRIYFLSSGEVTPFHLTLRRRGTDETYTLSGDARGKTKLSGADNGK